ncbi:MAG: PEP-CTERM sorting domain-containing protein [Gemmataceae bacterium]
MVPQVVPEPATITSALAGAFTVGGWMWRRRRSTKQA